MKSNGGRFGALPLVYRVLVICLVTLGLIIAGGTIYGLFFHANLSGKTPAKQTGAKQAGALPASGQGQTFTGIGRLRVTTKVPAPAPKAAAKPAAENPQPGMVILSVSFPYRPDDKAFSEELALRIGNFRDIITDYIGSFSTAELQKQSEENIKSELLRRFNAILRLGRIETLYFSDFMVIG